MITADHDRTARRDWGGITAADRRRAMQQWSDMTRAEARAIVAWNAGTLRRITPALRSAYAAMFGDQVRPADPAVTFRRAEPAATFTNGGPLRVESYGGGHPLPGFAAAPTFERAFVTADGPPDGNRLPHFPALAIWDHHMRRRWAALLRSALELRAARGAWIAQWAGGIDGAPDVPRTPISTEPAAWPVDEPQPAAELAAAQQHDRTGTAPTRGPNAPTRSELTSYRAPP